MVPDLGKNCGRRAVPEAVESSQDMASQEGADQPLGLQVTNRPPKQHDSSSEEGKAVMIHLPREPQVAGSPKFLSIELEGQRGVMCDGDRLIIASTGFIISPRSG